MPRKFRDEALRPMGTVVGLNWAMCALCLACFAVTGVLLYRELGLEARIASLESRCLRVQHTFSPPPVVDVELLQRIKTEIQEQLRQAQRLESSGAIFRPKRDISECDCPPGKPVSP